MKPAPVILSLLIMIIFSGCNEQSLTTGNFNAGQFTIRISESSHKNPSFEILNKDDSSKILLRSVADMPLINAAVAVDSIRMVGTPQGSFEVNDKIITHYGRQTIESIDQQDSASVVITGKLISDMDSVEYVFTLKQISGKRLGFNISIDDKKNPQINRMFLNYASASDEHFYGFGEQLTYFDQKGKVIPIMVSEHGVGRGLPVVTQYMNLAEDHAGGNPYTTGIPAPQYITSKMNSLYLENKQYSEFDLRRNDRVTVKLFSGKMNGGIIYGRTPKEILKEYTLYSGRMRKLPDWVDNGAIVCLQGGTEKVKSNLQKLLDGGVPVAGVWIQDWSGVRYTNVGSQLWWEWKLDTALYPGYHEMVSELREKNIRVLTYINPFLSNAPGHDSQFNEALQNGYLVKQHDGSPYLIKNTNFSAGLIDLSNPHACEWIKFIIRKNLIEDAGSSGWMCDFGEALPFNSVLHDSAGPDYWHNHYPEKWAEVNRQAIEEAGKGNDIVFFNRSGFTQSPAYSTLFWLGDQLQTWDEYDGLKTAVVGILSAGMSGFSLFHGDVGGYNAFEISAAGLHKPVIARDKELEWRWEELGAFFSLFRSHEGLNPKISVQVYDDSQTIEHFAKMTKLYTALAFYRKKLVAEAAETGVPVMRHMFMEYPFDRNVYSLRYQFMYGSDLLVAPVLDKNVKMLSVYLPKGIWINLWTGEKLIVDAGRSVNVDAPIGKPPVFYKEGSAAGIQLVQNLNLIY